jgi:Transposase DDE domain group 1
VEDAIRTVKNTGMRSLLFSDFEHNRVWLEPSLIAQELLCGARSLCLQGDLALAEPKRLRQRLLHVAGRLVRSARRVADAQPFATSPASSSASRTSRNASSSAGASLSRADAEAQVAALRLLAETLVPFAPHAGEVLLPEARVLFKK